MNFYNKQHKYYCGIDLHAKTMYLCILDSEGKKLLHRNIRNDAKYFLKLLEPYRADVVVAAECMFCWYWVADVCADEKIPFVLGHALYMQAIHGGKAKNDKIDSEKIAVFLRGGLIPQAYVYPQEMRATRDLMRRRIYFTHKRSELLAHIQMTKSQYNLPEFGKIIKYKNNRDGVPEHFPDEAVRKSVEADLQVLTVYEQTLLVLQRDILKAAKMHDQDALTFLQTIPGVGDILSLTLLYEIHIIERFPLVQDFLSYGRLIKCSHESAGKSSGTSGAKIGNAHIKWAMSEAAVLFLRHSERAKLYLKKLEKKHGKAKALSILASKLGRAVYHILKRKRSFDIEKFFNG